MTFQNRRLLLGLFHYTMTAVPQAATCIQERILYVCHRHTNSSILHKMHHNTATRIILPNSWNWWLVSRKQQDGGHILGTLDKVKWRVPAQSYLMLVRTWPNMTFNQYFRQLVGFSFLFSKEKIMPGTCALRATPFQVKFLTKPSFRDSETHVSRHISISKETRKL